MTVPGRVCHGTCGSTYYANSAPCVSALVEDDDGRVLLARRAVEPYRGLWDPLGGFLEEGEHPEDALRRELLEETGLRCEPVRFLGVWMDVYGDAPEARGDAQPLLDDADRVRGAGGGRRRRGAALVRGGRASVGRPARVLRRRGRACGVAGEGS